MQSRFRNIISVLLLCFYIAGGVLIEMTHHDVAAFGSPTEARLSHHDCGDATAHVAPDAGNCLACTHANYRVAIEIHLQLPPQIVTALNRHIVRSIGQILQADILYSGKRGPPSA